jgi:hypothetical protein
MRLWTIQTEEAWKHARERRVLVSDARRVPRAWQGAYRWMATTMRRQIGPPPRGIVTPIWAWHRWNRHNARPDLRARGHVQRGVRAVRLEFSAADDRVLCSDFEAWHFVLNDWYLPSGEADNRRFETRLRRCGVDRDAIKFQCSADTSLRSALERSWDGIFAVDKSTASVQACLWELPVAAVTDVTFFRGR